MSRAELKDIIGPLCVVVELDGWMDGICFGCSSNLGVIINYVGGVIIISSSRSTAAQHLQHHHVHAGWDFGVIADRREFISLTFKISYPNL